MAKQIPDEKENVTCPVCKKPVNVRDAWWDVYAPGGMANVHHECLSPTRLQEINQITKHD